MRQFYLTASILSAALLAACSGGETTAPTPEAPKVEAPVAITLADAIAHPRRADDMARDKFRNPQATLEFFDVQPDQRVAEIWPGWYTQILAPYLSAGGGQYIAVIYPDGASERADKRNASFREKFGDESEYGAIEYGAFGKDAGPILPAESVDTILSFRNVHNWMGGGYADQAFADFYAALKPGGTLGIVEHRLPETALQDPKGGSGYVQESYMKALAADAGFEFVESSEVNANPLDTADHPMGVWTLPPRSATPKEGSAEAEDFNAEAYKNIGESDRATLKFRKPL
ncbi:class I SAM-dependent methyltransferase [Litorimonas sp. RW-G-Af-16]|uniref:class I SAM-dependent methyltransferase n=1 Tax=Litorimonas sp. RW-G-Af-16 TaxID=3241168 RepID=UPI00390C9DB2